MTESKSTGPITRPCVKCRAQEATLDSRSQPVCRDCFTKFIATKCIKQIGLLGKETRPLPPPTGGPPTGTRHYLLGLSLGVSSTVLLHLLNENVEFNLAKGRSPPFDLTVLHIDTTITNSQTQPGLTQCSQKIEQALNAYRARYPRFTFLRLPLSSALPGTASPLSGGASASTAASREDITRHLTRRALIAQARARGCQALLLGHSTTALAELTLAEAAKGRGFALPWIVSDGPAPSASLPFPGVSLGGSGACDGDGEAVADLGRVGKGERDGVGVGVGNGDSNGNGTGTGNGAVEEGKEKGRDTLLVYHPLRDALRKELVIYAGLVDPPLTDLIQPDKQDDGAVVSHKDLSIEEVMTRYFAEVEESYPSVVANVARTTGKLVRVGEESEECCGLCGMPLDEDGDERWRGELGIQEGLGAGTASALGRLCYGCERSTAGQHGDR